MTLVQSEWVQFSGAGSLPYSSAPTAGHLLVAVIIQASGGVQSGGISGWTFVGSGGGTFDYETEVYWRAAPGGSLTVSPLGLSGQHRLTIMEFDVIGLSVEDIAEVVHAGPSTASPFHIWTLGDVTTAGAAVIVAASNASDPGPINLYWDPPDGWTQDNYGRIAVSTTNYQNDVTYIEVGAGTHDYDPVGNHGVYWGGVLVAFEAGSVFTADFSATPTSGTVTAGGTLAITFSDESSGGTGTPDTWLWDFGDGTTSTLENPTHSYPQGSYTVTLTVTTDDDETDTVTRTSFINITGDYVAPDPGGALIEIYAASPGSYRWGIAHWGESVWSDAGWQDVTPQSVSATVRWGSHSPGSGVLAETEAATWDVDTYDPDRLLDPGNEASPYHADLRAGLPVRIRHRGTIIRQGVAETIAFYHAQDFGRLRVTDNVSLMARTPVPADSIIADTLRARARDVISAAGLRVTVEGDPPAGDPAIAPRLDGEASVWRHIADAAQQVLHLPYIDRLGTLKFRAWATPYERARSVDETQLVDLGTIVQTRGLYSAVQAQQTVGDGGLLIERRLTPTPRYGAVTYTRSDETIDADAWADAVLADRSLQTVQWLPGDIYPLTATAVEYFATLEGMERFGVDHLMADPPVSISGIIVGGEIRVMSKKDSEARWRFALEMAQTAAVPLFVDDADPPEFLYHEDGVTVLYPG